MIKCIMMAGKPLMSFIYLIYHARVSPLLCNDGWQATYNNNLYNPHALISPSLCNQGCSKRCDYVIHLPRHANYISIPGPPPPHLKCPGGMGVGHIHVPHPHDVQSGWGASTPTPTCPPHPTWGRGWHGGMGVDAPHPEQASWGWGVWARDGYIICPPRRLDYIIRPCGAALIT